LTEGRGSEIIEFMEEKELEDLQKWPYSVIENQRWW